MNSAYKHYAKRDDTNLYFAVDGFTGSPRPSLGAQNDDRSAQAKRKEVFSSVTNKLPMIRETHETPF